MLQRRGQHYASRIIVPSTLQPMLRRMEITRSLRTTDVHEARRRLGFWESHIHSLFAAVRKFGAAMTPEQLEALTLQYLRTTFDEIEDRLALDWTPEGLEEWGFQLNERCHGLAGALSWGDLSQTIGAAKALAPTADGKSHRKLARRMLEIQLKAGAAELDALSGSPLERPRELSAAHSMGSTGTPTPAKPTPLISEVARMYCEERIARGSWTPKTREQNQKIYEVVAGLLGDGPIGMVTKSDIRQFGLDVPRLPANMTKKYPGLGVRDILERTSEATDVQRLKARSVNKHFQLTRSLFAWAQEHDLIATSPASILRDVDEGRAQDARKDFTDEDISALFAYIDRIEPAPFGIWIPRIMAYTGCRMGEAAQLRKVDVREEGGVWVFDINAQSLKKNLKTDAATRLVPIHPRLLELGVLDFAAACEDEFLFPERVRYTNNAVRGNVDALSKQLNRWLRKAGVTDRRKAFQSFRATFITRLKNQQIPDYQIAEIVGHENDNITTGRYGKNANLATRQDVVAKVELPI